MSTISLVRSIEKKNFFSLLGLKMFNYSILPFNLVVKSATADLVPLNSVLVEAKFVIAVSKSVEVAEPIRSIVLKQVSKLKENELDTSK